MKYVFITLVSIFMTTSYAFASDEGGGVIGSNSMVYACRAKCSIVSDHGITGIITTHDYRINELGDVAGIARDKNQAYVRMYNACNELAQKSKIKIYVEMSVNKGLAYNNLPNGWLFDPAGTESCTLMEVK